MVDTTDPAMPAGLASSSHGAPSSEPRIAVSWLTAVDPPAPGGYASGPPATSTSSGRRRRRRAGAGALGAAATDTRSGILGVGELVFPPCAADAVGNESTAAVLGPLTIPPDVTPPAGRADRQRGPER